ncbi:MAG: hypothetical protein JST00_18265 [Deltaproteobacteria bacterium]|nr:hypothetical protein [Deltaproteobacteria bacterium]
MMLRSNALGRFAVVCSLAFAMGCAVDTEADGPLPGDEADLGQDRAEVQAASSWKQFAIVQDGSRAAKATGVLEVPLRNPDGTQASLLSNGPWGFPAFLPVRGTCGVTFISPHYAVTAAHCVEQANIPDPASTTLTVRQFDVSGASLLGLNAAALIKGTYPNYEPLGTAMANVPGYQSMALSCKLVSRCTTTLISSPSFNCDFSGDVAMLHCSDRASNGAWLPVASSDPLEGPVEMYWFHELLSPIPLTSPPAGSPLVDFDRFNHYTLLDARAADKLAARKKNWHYIGSKTNALLPLKSVPWSDGTPRTRLNHTTSTDLFGCHGTSGSGVLQRNATGDLELLGPVSTGGGWAETRLCADPDAFQPRQTGLAYTPNGVVQQMQAKYSRAIQLDRKVLVLDPLPPVIGVVR